LVHEGSRNYFFDLSGYRISDLLLIGRGSFAEISDTYQDRPSNNCCHAIDGPLDLTGHEAPWEDVDALQRPYQTNQDQ
jgi:hypothetical protein